MDAKTQLKQIAIQIANDHLETAESLKPEFHKIKTRLAQIEAQLDAAKLYHQRLPHFEPEIGGNLQCPRCWVLNETKTTLTPIPSDTEDNYFRRCLRCGIQIEIEI